MAERSIEKGRGMSPIRGYPPLMRKENQTPRLFAVAGFSVINDSAEFIASIQGDISDPSEQCAVSAVSEMIAARLHDFGQIVPIQLSNEFQAWRIELSGDSPLLDGSIGLMLDYKVLEELAAQILTRLSLVVQFVVSSVYPDTDDISLALDAVTSLEALKAGVQEIFSMLEEDYQPELRYLLSDSLPSSLLICFLSQYSELCVSCLFYFYVFALYAHLHHKRICIQHHWQEGDSTHSLDFLQKSFCRQ